MAFFHNAAKKQLLVSLNKAQGNALKAKLKTSHKANLVQVGNDYVLEISFVGRSGVARGEFGYFYDGSNPPIIHQGLADLLETDVTGPRTPGNFQPRLIPSLRDHFILNQYLATATVAAPAPTAATVTGTAGKEAVHIPYNASTGLNSVGANTTLCAKPLEFKIPGYPATLKAPSLEVFYQAAKVSLGARLPAESHPEYQHTDGSKTDQHGRPHQGETNTMRAIFDTAWQNLDAQHKIQQTYGTSSLAGSLSSVQDPATGAWPAGPQPIDYATTFNNNSAAIMFQLELMKFSQDLNSYNHLMNLCGGDPTKLDLVESCGDRDTFWGCNETSRKGCNYQGQIVKEALIYLHGHQIPKGGRATGFTDPNGVPLAEGYTHFYDNIPAKTPTLSSRFTDTGTKGDGTPNLAKITMAPLGQLAYQLNGSFYNSAALNPSIQSYAATKSHEHLSHARLNGQLQTGGLSKTVAPAPAAVVVVAPPIIAAPPAPIDPVDKECDLFEAVVTIGLNPDPTQAKIDRDTIKRNDRVIIEIGKGDAPTFSDTERVYTINISKAAEKDLGLFKQEVDAQIKLFSNYASNGGLVALIKDQNGDLAIKGLNAEQARYINQAVTQEIGSITRTCDMVNPTTTLRGQLQAATTAYKKPTAAPAPTAAAPSAPLLAKKTKGASKFSFTIDENSWKPNAAGELGVMQYLKDATKRDVIVDPAGVAFPGTGRMIDTSAGGASQAIYKKIYPNDTAYNTFPYGRPISDEDRLAGKTSGKGFALNAGEAVFNNTIKEFLIIHSIGPIYSNIVAKDEATKKKIFEDKLRETFVSVIEEWSKSGGQNLRIPLISGGIFAKGLELEEYCKIATRALNQAIIDTGKESVASYIHLTPAKEVEAKFLKFARTNDPSDKPTKAEIDAHKTELEAQDDELVDAKTKDLGLRSEMWFFTIDHNLLSIGLTYKEALITKPRFAFPLKQPIGTTSDGVVTEELFSLLQESSMFRKRVLNTVTQDHAIIKQLKEDPAFLEHVVQSAITLYGAQYKTNAEARAIIDNIGAVIPEKSKDPIHARVSQSIKSIQNPPAFTVTPAAAAAPKPPAPKIKEPALDCDAQTLADYLIAQQQVIYDRLFTPTAGKTTLNAKQNNEIQNHVKPGIDWEIFPSSSLSNAHKSVIGAVDEKWVQTAQIATDAGKNAKDTIDKGQEVYQLLSDDKTYCTNYVDCVRKYIASHGPNDKIYGTRFDKLVESLVGLTAENTRRLAGFQTDEEQFAFIQEVRKFQIEKNHRTDVKHWTDLSSETKDYSKQFFQKLAEIDYDIQKGAEKVLDAAVSGSVTSLIDNLSGELTTIQAGLPDNYSHDVSKLTGDHTIVGNTKKRWLARQTDPAHLDALKAQFGEDQIGIFKKVDYTHDHATPLKAPRKKPAVTKTKDWVKWGAENTPQMVFQVNYASGHYGGDTFSHGSGLVQEETKAYLSTTAALITANKDKMPKQLQDIGGMAVREGGKKGTKPTPVAIIGQIGDFESDPETMPAGKPRGEETPEWIAIAKGDVLPENIITKRKKFVKFNELAIAADHIDAVGGKHKGNDTKETVKALFDNSLAGFQLAKQLATNQGAQCKIDTGLFGAGAFNNTAEFSIAMQYLAAQIAEVDSIEFFGIDKKFQSQQIDKITAAIDDMIDEGLSSDAIIDKVLTWQERKDVKERNVWRKDVPAVKAKSHTPAPTEAEVLAAARLARENEAQIKAAEEKAIREAAERAAKEAAELERARKAAEKAENAKRREGDKSKIKEFISGPGQPADDGDTVVKRQNLINSALVKLYGDANSTPDDHSNRLSISKGNILMFALLAAADAREIEAGGKKGDGDYLREVPAAKEESTAELKAKAKTNPLFFLEGKGHNKTAEEQAKERITITSEMMSFQPDGANIKKTQMMIGGKNPQLLPSPGLEFATLAGLRLVDVSGTPPMFAAGTNMFGMNFNGCDVSGLNLSEIDPVIFASLKFSNCVGIDTIERPFTDASKTERVKFKTSAITTKLIDGTVIQSAIKDAGTAHKIMEKPEDYGEKGAATWAKKPDSAMKKGIELSLEKLRDPDPNPKSPTGIPLTTARATSRD